MQMTEYALNSLSRREFQGIHQLHMFLPSLSLKGGNALKKM